VAPILKIRRGDIWWADLDPTRGREQSGRRPVLVLSRDVFNDRSGTVIAVALTSQEPTAGFPLTLELSEATLPKKSWVKVSQIRTLSVLRLNARVGQASAEELQAVIEGLYEIIGD
jgi:mRNA interferase MazF